MISTNGLQSGLMTHGRYRRLVYMAISPVDMPMFVNITTDMLFTMKYGIPSAKYSVGIHDHGEFLIMLFQDNNVAISDDRYNLE
jgi:hypothetical protein